MKWLTQRKVTERRKSRKEAWQLQQTRLLSRVSRTTDDTERSKQNKTNNMTFDLLLKLANAKNPH